MYLHFQQQHRRFQARGCHTRSAMRAAATALAKNSFGSRRRSKRSQMEAAERQRPARVYAIQCGHDQPSTTFITVQSATLAAHHAMPCSSPALAVRIFSVCMAAFFLLKAMHRWMRILQLSKDLG